MFRGSSEISMDAKGRIAVPARYRDALMVGCNGRLVVTIDIQDKCLLIYPEPEWESVERQIAALPTLNPNTRRLQRLLIGHARELELDSSGRVLIPPELRSHAELEKTLMLVGQGHRLELWAEKNWSLGRIDWLLEASSPGAGAATVPEEMLNLSL
ncbi:MAG: division/cell wall cluster transcriptional repressor MraZ [Porticoccaceae bacterium]